MSPGITSHMNTSKSSAPPSAIVDAVVQIEKLVHGGEGLARHDGQVVLVPFVLPAERVSISAQRVKTGLLRGSVSEILEPAPERVVPRCEYFTRCGGCHLQHASYPAQLEQKRAILLETLHRLGGIQHTGEIETLSAEPWFYRNRVQLHFQHGQSGFHRAGSHKIEPIDHCYISSPLLVEAIAALSAAVRRPEWPTFLRSLELFTNEIDLQLNVLDSQRPVAARFFEWMKSVLPSLLQGALTYKAAGHDFRIGSGSFFQTNRFLMDALVAEVVGNASGESAADLYSGVGLFSLPLAKRFQQVNAVERGASAFRDLDWNKQNNGAENLIVTRSSAEEFLRSIERAPDLVVADPPRAGLGPETVTELLRIQPARLTIVSCDPATLARDLKKLCAGGFRIIRLTLVDLFPQTYHFETVTHLERA